jgi:hypothetical protein
MRLAIADSAEGYGIARAIVASLISNRPPAQALNSTCVRILSPECSPSLLIEDPLCVRIRSCGRYCASSSKASANMP